MNELQPKEGLQWHQTLNNALFGRDTEIGKVLHGLILEFHKLTKETPEGKAVAPEEALERYLNVRNSVIFHVGVETTADGEALAILGKKLREIPGLILEVFSFGGIRFSGLPSGIYVCFAEGTNDPNAAERLRELLEAHSFPSLALGEGECLFTIAPVELPRLHGAALATVSEALRNLRNLRPVERPLFSYLDELPSPPAGAR